MTLAGMVWFAVGFGLGGMFGFVIAACCAMAAKQDD